MENSRKKRKGGALWWTSRVTGSAGSFPSVWGGLSAKTLAEATGLSALVESKLGLVCLTLVVTALVLSLPVLFRDQGEQTQGRSEQGQMLLDALIKEASNFPKEPAAVSSLEYASGASAKDQVPGAAETPTDAAAPPERPTNVLVPMEPAKRSRFVKRTFSGIPPPRAPMQTLELLPSDSQKIGHKFQDIYKSPQPQHPPLTQKPPSYGALRSEVFISAGGGALAQAKTSERLSQMANRSPHMSLASALASVPFDSRTLGTSLAGLAGQGINLGWDGTFFKANNFRNWKNLVYKAPPLPSQEANKTPYQGLVWAAVAALLVGAMLLALAAKLVEQARRNRQGALLAQARALALAAAGAGALTVAIGLSISRDFTQLAQGLMFILTGGVLIVSALKVLLDASSGQTVLGI